MQNDIGFSTSLSGTVVEAGLLSETQLAEVQKFQSSIGGSLRQAVMKLGLLREQDLLKVYEKVLSLECIETSAFPVPSLDDIKRAMTALDVTDGWLSALDVVIWVDSKEPETRNFIQRDPLDTNGEESIQKFWTGHLQQFLATNRTLDSLFAQLSADAGARSLHQDTSADVARLRELAEEAPVIDFVKGFFKIDKLLL